MNNNKLDLGKGPILPLLLKMSLPPIISFLAMALYNIVDTFWIAKISPSAIAALTICFPVQMIFGAIGMGTGVGAGSFASRMFGAGKYLKARQTAGQAIFLSLFFGILIILSVTLYHEPILRFFGATKDILAMSQKYFVVVVFGSPFLFFMLMSDNLFRAAGNPNYSMYVIISSTILNAILDPLLIFGLGPFPAMGIQGAALATAISQFVTIFPAFYFLTRSSFKHHLKWRYLIPNLSIIKSIYRVGFPSSVMNLALSLMLTVHNHILGNFGPLAIATLGLNFRINGIAMMLLFGIAHGVMPLVGFNYGAHQYKRLMHIVRVAAKLSFLVAVVSCLIIEVFARPILFCFTKDPELLSIAVPALRLYVSMLILLGPTIVWISMFNGLGKGFTSMCLLVTRHLAFLVPLLFILPLWFGLNGVWLAHPVSTVLMFFIALFWTKREFRTFGRNHNPEDMAESSI
ncbi:MAG: MATE family efflux transporter [Proteobacteria bacterium]|nr:MATE family efflux transporter [Pseudomonadota bacterium]